MLAVIELGGNQFIVRTWDIIEVKKLSIEVGENISVPALLLADEEGSNVQIGAPLLSESKVECKVLTQFQWEKVRVFKMKSKKRYMRNTWFRPRVTKLEVLHIA